MPDLTRWAIEKKAVAYTFLFLIFVFGILSYFQLSKAEDPGFIVRAARVTAFFPGASPERVELLVTDQLEKSILEMPEIDFITSESRTGASIVTVHILEQYKNMQPIWDNLRRKMARAVPSLPEGVVGPFVDDEFGDVFGIILSIRGDGFSDHQIQKIAEKTRDELLFLPDVAKVEIFGRQEERIFIEYRDSRLAERGLSAKQLKQILHETNMLNTGGSLVTETERILVEPSGNFDSIEDLRNMVVALPGQKDVLTLQDLVDIRRGTIDPPTNRMHTNGQPSLALAISMRQGGDILRLGQQIRQLLPRWESEHPIGIQFETIAFQPDEVGNKIRDFLFNLFQSIAIVLVAMLFTLGLRTGLVVATLIPMTILSTFMIMAFFHIGIDQISLAALIISLGILVDNAIVMSESILNQSKEGIPLAEAALSSSKELRVSLFTSSLTTAFAFLPIFLAKTVSAEYTAPLFQVVTISLLASWLLSLTMIPLLCVTFMTRKTSPVDSILQKGYANYRRLLSFLLRYRTLALLGFSTAFACSLYGFCWIPKAFFPASDRPLLTIELDLPSGTKIEHTEKVVKELEGYLDSEWQASKDSEGVVSWASFIGGMAPRYVVNYNPDSANPEKAYLLLNTSSLSIIPLLQEDLEEFLLNRSPEVRATLRKTFYGPPVKAPIGIRISGKEEASLFPAVQKVKKKLAETPGIRNIRDNWGERSKKVRVKINQAKARRAGITSRDIAGSLQALYSGVETSLLREAEETIPIILRAHPADRENMDRLETLHVSSQATGASVPLKQVAEIELAWQNNKIVRRNRQKTVTIETDLEPGFTSAGVFGLLQPWLNTEQQDWPEDLFYEAGGEVESSAKSRRAIEEQMPLAGLLILLILVMQFNSFRLPLIILLTIPLGIIGVVIGLLATGSYFGFMTLLGIVSLSGIVINNAIVLLDRIEWERRFNQKNPQDAILDASVRRLRPIFLTSMTTICGLIPLWTGGGAMFAPMAISIIFGLLFATLLTLGFVPMLYSVLFRVPFPKKGWNSQEFQEES